MCILLRHAIATWIVTSLVAWLSFGISCALFLQVQAEGVISYAIGGWISPWGIEYRVDALNSFILIIVSGIGAIVATFACESVQKEISKDRIYLFSDGYADQFGGERGKKLKVKNFKKLLIAHSSNNLKEQQRRIHDNLITWMGDLDQLD